jgi:16S rRNA (adenine1518-N6/adenine1519-N6)-dimethyltransferase
MLQCYCLKNIMLSISKLLKKYDIKPKREFGQNFLIDKNILNKIVTKADLKDSDNVLEVGPGLGVLTEQLLLSVKKVLAVELDKTLHYVLKQEFKRNPKLELVNEDILKMRVEEIKEIFSDEPYSVVANIPYNITSILIRKFLEFPYKPEKMFLLVQKEVAQRIISRPGEMNLLALSAQFYAECKILFPVSRKSFFPSPSVDSAVIELKLKKDFPTDNINRFFQLARIGFASKRKQLQNNLANGLHISKEEAKDMLEKAGLGISIRAQELSIDDWVKLVGYESTDTTNITEVI